jgi:accessory gene regulator B
MLIGGVLHMFWLGLLFLTAFVPLRTYAGGYHARGYVSCYIGSCALITLLLLLLKYFVLGKNMTSGIWLLFFISVPVIFLLAPLADENKPITEKEETAFRRRTRILLLIEIVMVVWLDFKRSIYAYAVMTAIILCALLLVMYKCREFRRWNITEKS